MTGTDLEQIEGVGPARADRLRDAGLEDAEAVAVATLETLDDALSNSADSEGIRSAALTATDDDEPEDDPEDVVVEEKDVREETRPLSIDDRRYAIYLVKGLIDESMRRHARNDVDGVEMTNNLVERVMSELDDDGVSLDVNLDDLSLLYTSVRNIEQEVQQTRGLTDLAGDIRQLRTEVQDLRSDLWPDS